MDERDKIEAVAKSFIPTFEWTKIYDKTCYYGGEDEEGKEDLRSVLSPFCTSTEFIPSLLRFCLISSNLLSFISRDNIEAESPVS